MDISSQSVNQSYSYADYRFGGWKHSIFGDRNAYGPEGVGFYTKLKTTTARWPTGLRAGAEFVMPTMK